MRDRTPTKALENGALRYGVYGEDGSLLRHEYLALEDDPTDPGTELSKATLLQDSTEVSLFGSAADRTVDDAFVGIANKFSLISKGAANITVTVKDELGNPLKNVVLAGVFSADGGDIKTGDDGKASGYIFAGNSASYGVENYADIEDISDSFEANAGGTYEKTLIVKTRNYFKITSSASVRFSGNVNEVDIAIGGGGGAGRPGSSADRFYIDGGNGGGMGTVVTQVGIVPEPNKMYQAIIGAGGNTNGGVTSFMGYSADGGVYGGGGKGARSSNYSGDDYRYAPTPGAAGSQSLFGSFTTTMPYGGAGGGGGSQWEFNYKYGGAMGGDPGGGTGANTFEAGKPGVDGLGGGGGGGSSVKDSTRTDGGRGGNGCITMRMHLKSAA